VAAWLSETVPRSPVAPPEGRRMELEKGKTADRKRYRKSRMAKKKTGMALIKKKTKFPKGN
jgi:hypothetical protein